MMQMLWLHSFFDKTYYALYFDVDEIEVLRFSNLFPIGMTFNGRQSMSFVLLLATMPSVSKLWEGAFLLAWDNHICMLKCESLQSQLSLVAWEKFIIYDIHLYGKYFEA